MSHRISYRTYGDSNTCVVLVHGYGGSILHWDGVVEKLSPHYHVVVPNLSHLYMSQDKLLFSVQVSKFAQFLKETFHGRSIHLVGTSYGAAICWALSTMNPELVDTLTLINPMVTFPIQNFLPAELKYFLVLPMSAKAIYILLSTPIGKSFLHRTAQLFREDRRTDFSSPNVGGRKLMFVAHLLSQFSWILRTEDWGHWENRLMSDLYVRTLLIYDEKDPLFHHEVYESFEDMIEPERTIVTAGAGHLLMKENPELMARAILKHIENKKEKIELPKTGTESA